MKSNTSKSNKPMTNYNERLDEVLDTLLDDYSKNRAKQAITSLIKELVADAKPSRKRVALEARLDELKRLQRLSVYTENVHQKIDRVVSTRLNSLAELKAQQEDKIDE